jgi:ATP-binding protein involved in chromosome partitioning
VVTVNLAAALAMRGLTVGVLDADIWGFSVPRMLGVEGRLGGADGLIHPNEKRVGDGLLKVISMGLLVDAEEQALMWRGLVLTKALEQFLTDVRWGPMDYLLVDMPPGLARLLPTAEMVIVTTPALSAQKVAIRAADMARRGYLRIVGVVENMSGFTCEHGETHALFGEGGGADLARSVGVQLLGRIPLEASVSTGSDVGRPVALGEGVAAEAFRAIARTIVEEVAPPLEMSGCTARMLADVEAAVAARP